MESVNWPPKIPPKCVEWKVNGSFDVREPHFTSSILL